MSKEIPDIILVDDHAIFRKGIRTLIEVEGIGKVTAEAENGIDLLDLLDREHPDIILLDIEMPGMSGVEAAKKVLQKHPHMKIIVLSMYDSDVFNTDLMIAGVKGILRKTVDIDELKRAIHDVMSEGYSISIDIMNQVIACKHKNIKSKALREEAVRFTDREIELLEMLCRGLSTREIAREMELAPKTVENYRMRLLNKTNSPNTVSLAVYAIKHGLVTLG